MRFDLAADQSKSTRALVPCLNINICRRYMRFDLAIHHLILMASIYLILYVPACQKWQGLHVDMARAQGFFCTFFCMIRIFSLVFHDSGTTEVARGPVAVGCAAPSI